MYDICVRRTLSFCCHLVSRHAGITIEEANIPLSISSRIIDGVGITACTVRCHSITTNTRYLYFCKIQCITGKTNQIDNCFIIFIINLIINILYRRIAEMAFCSETFACSRSRTSATCFSIVNIESLRSACVSNSNFCNFIYKCG